MKLYEFLLVDNNIIWSSLWETFGIVSWVKKETMLGWKWERSEYDRYKYLPVLRSIIGLLYNLQTSVND